MNNNYQAEELINKYKNGTCTDEERALVESWHVKDIADSQHTPSPENISLVHARMRDQIIHHAYGSSRKTLSIWPRIGIAAAVLSFITFGIYFYLQTLPQPETAYINQSTKFDIGPGGNRAILTLGNGKRISLTDANTGQLAEESGIKISKTADGQISYTELTISAPLTDSKVQFNTIETPKGGKYQVVLPDGSKVWINSDSKITYPSTFAAKKERRVIMEGEAFFEVSKNKDKPFIVETRSQEIEVLGTKFNVNSYKDESEVKTTLLEGSVKIRRKNGMNNILEPGQQAVLTPAKIEVTEIDPEQAVAWKNNQFIFESSDIQYIMRMVARWYNVEIVYEGVIPDDKFGGAVSRYGNVSEVLRPLEATGKVKFIIGKDRIIVKR